MLYCHCAALLFIIKTEKSTVSYFSGGGGNISFLEEFHAGWQEKA